MSAAQGVAMPSEGGAPASGWPGPRVDALEKVTGFARYAEDIQLPGLLHAVLVRSPYPHARVLAIDPQPSLELPGVVQVLTAADVPGRNSLEGYSHDEPLLTAIGDTVRMTGAAVALVVAESPKAARLGAAAVRVRYEPLPYTYDAAAAMAPDAPQVCGVGNVLRHEEIHFGTLNVAQAGADLVLEARYLTPFMEHAALERETVLSYVDDGESGKGLPSTLIGGVPSSPAKGGGDRITVIAGHQEPHWAQGWIAAALALAPEQVRVIVPPMGGAFGGRQDPWPLMAGALAAYRVRRPVRLTYTRRESFEASPKRHAYCMDVQVGARRDGTLAGLHLRIVANTGAYDSGGYHIPEYALVAGGGPYNWQAVDAAAWAVYTNSAKAGQMRGFGTPQPTFARECMLDQVAAALEMDPLELRLRNAIDAETTTFLGYRVAETVGYRECLEAMRSTYREAIARGREMNANRPSPWRRGAGLAGMWYRFGKSEPIECAAEAELGLDGQISLYFSAPDYGQGTTTVMGQLAADAMGLPRQELRLVNADTALTPDSGIQGASRSTYWVGGAVARAAGMLRERMLDMAAEVLDCPPGRLELTPAAVLTPEGNALRLPHLAAEMERIGLSRRVTGVFAPGQAEKDAETGEGRERRGAGRRPGYLPYFVTGVHLAEVEVNIETGQVDVERVVAIHDVGRIINPQGARGQVEGAVVMGVGAALSEEYIPGVSTGFSDYYLPTVRMAPSVEVVFVELPSRFGPKGAKGLGEAAALPTAPAIINAITQATGAHVRTLPATPERVLAAIQDKNRRGSHLSLSERAGCVGPRCHSG